MIGRFLPVDSCMAVLESDAATAKEDKNAGIVLQIPKANISCNSNETFQ